MTDEPGATRRDSASTDQLKTPKTQKPLASRGSFFATDTADFASGCLNSLLDHSLTEDFFVKSAYFRSPGPEYFATLRRDVRSRVPERSPLPRSGWFHDQRQYRETLVGWMDQVCIQMRISGRTLALAITILDILAETLPAPRPDTKLAGLVCLFVASKLIEPQGKCLRFELIWDFFRGKISKDDIFRVEQLVFKSLGFNAHRTTAYDYLVHFMSSGFVTAAELAVLTGDDPAHAPLERQELTLLQLLLELAKEATINQFAPDLVAATLICFLRQALGLCPWPPGLTTNTGFRQDELSDCLAIVSHVLDSDGLGPAAPVTYNSMTRQYLSHFQLWQLTPGGRHEESRASPSRKSSISALYEADEPYDPLGEDPSLRPRRTDSFRLADEDDEAPDDPFPTQPKRVSRRPDSNNN